MQYSAAFVAQHGHQADVHRAEAELSHRRSAAERAADEPAPARERVHWWSRTPQHALRLAPR